jgi:hypothetical protein
LRALGETHDMDITIEGFHRWMFRKLSIPVVFYPARGPPPPEKLFALPEEKTLDSGSENSWT